MHLFFGIGIFQHFFCLFVREESRRVFNFCQSPSIHLAVNIFDIRRSSQSSSSFISNMFFCLSIYFFYFHALRLALSLSVYRSCAHLLCISLYLFNLCVTVNVLPTDPAIYLSLSMATQNGYTDLS